MLPATKNAFLLLPLFPLLFFLPVAADSESRKGRRKAFLCLIYERGPNHIFEREVTVFFKFFFFFEFFCLSLSFSLSFVNVWISLSLSLSLSASIDYKCLCIVGGRNKKIGVGGGRKNTGKRKEKKDKNGKNQGGKQRRF